MMAVIKFFQNTLKGRSSYRHGSAITLLSLVKFCTCLYMTCSPEPLLPEIRRVLVQTPLPFRSMTAVRCGRGCTFVAPLMQYSTRWCPSAKAMSGVNFVRSDLGLHHCVPTNLGKPLSFGIWPLFGNSNALSRFLWHEAYNPYIKGLSWPCKSLPLTSPSLLCLLF
ncbi:hypothetical protein BGY98DRAFT_431076 [Russula aff. rugulosa BPL654]|nr:hypothetical protein BGY98DRAFT_431076 [Russula aff. rugulosa BPL654]